MIGAQTAVAAKESWHAARKLQHMSSCDPFDACKIIGMEDRPKKRGGPLHWLAARSRRFWIIASVVALVSGYPLSFGPAIWLTARGYFRESAVQSFYMPLLMSSAEAESLGNAVEWWGSLGVPDDKSVTFIFQTDEALVVFQFTRTGEGIPLGPGHPPANGEM